MSEPFGDKQIEYPVEVHFRIIAEALEEVSAAVRSAAALRGLESRLRPGNQSAGGRYQTWNLSVRVNSGEELREIDAGFRSVPGVKMVL